MSTEFKQDLNRNYQNKIAEILKISPGFMRDFYSYMRGGQRVDKTHYDYINDVIAFLRYEKEFVPEFREVELKDIPVSVFDQFTLKDMDEYRIHLRTVQRIENSSIKRRFAALSVFYKFLNTYDYTKNNPLLNFEMPKLNKKHIIKLDSELSNKLLSGILRNDLYLDTPKDLNGTETEITRSGKTKLDFENKVPVPIPDNVRKRREKLVLRNFAIVTLFLGSGLRVSELVGLDLSDVNFRKNSLTIIKKGGDETEVFFNDDVAEALKAYINDTPLPLHVLKKYLFSNEELFNWCAEHIDDPDFDKEFENAFPDSDNVMIKEAQELKAASRFHGRNSLGPVKNEHALFITARGTRMQVRMVELMIKEMANTYIPEFEDVGLFSPHKLRATCATRILTQTGDIELASTQLNHSNIAVTAAFYAELKKEQQKDKIKSLEIDKW